MIKQKHGMIVICLRISLIIICVLGVAICALAYPFQVSLTAIGVPSGERVPPTMEQYIEYWVQLGFYWIASIPCFLILLFGWDISSEIKKGNAFSMKVSKKLDIAAKILFVDSMIYLLAQLVFTMLDWNPFVIIMIIVGLIGLILSFVLYLAARYVQQATIIKEENETYI